jgi:hypothetical protein
MIVATASLAVDQSGIAKELLWALIVPMALFATGLTPYLLHGIQMIVDGQLVLLVIVRLFNDALYHGHALCEIVIGVGRDEHVHRLLLVNLLSIVNFAFTLGTSTSDLNLAPTLALKLLLRLALWANDLAYIVDRRIIRIWNVDATVLLRRLVVGRRLNIVRDLNWLTW